MGRKKGKNVRIRLAGDFVTKVLIPKRLSAVKVFSGYEGKGNETVGREWVTVRVTPAVYDEICERKISSYQDKDGNWNKEDVKFFEIELLDDVVIGPQSEPIDSTDLTEE